MAFEAHPQLVRDFLFYLEIIKGRSKRTVEGYATDLRVFFRFMLIHKGIMKTSMDSFDEVDISQIDLEFIKTVTLKDVYEFLHFTLSRRENQPKARARKASSIKGFFKYLTVNEKLLKENPVNELELPSLKKSLPKYLSLEESIKLLNSVRSALPLRDYCIITLFLNCGMRLSELVGINLSDISYTSHTLRLLGKGNKERIIYLNPACFEAIRNYMENERGAKQRVIDENALFLSRAGRRLGGRQVELIIQKTLKNAGLGNEGYSPHKLRHTAATLMYQHGNVDIRVLKDILGHANIGTTEIYTHVSDKNMEEAMSKNPLSRIKKPEKKE